MKEKRNFIRFDIPLKVHYTVQGDPKIVKTGITKDVSAGGVQLLTEEKIDIGNKIDLTVFIPEALNPVHLAGIAVWVKEIRSEEKSRYCTGIEFTKIEEDNKNTFLKFLCNLMYKKMSG